MREVATRDAVLKAALHLIAEQQPVTADRIRDQIGGGSKTTILARLAEVREELIGGKNGSAAPASISKAADAFVNAVWNAAQAEATATFERDRRGWGLLWDGRDQDLKSEQDRADALQVALDQATARGAELERALTASSVRVAELREEAERNARLLAQRTDELLDAQSKLHQTEIRAQALATRLEQAEASVPSMRQLMDEIRSMSRDGVRTSE